MRTIQIRPDQEDVASVMSRAVDGDVISFPAGRWRIHGSVSIQPGVQIIGVGDERHEEEGP